MGPMGVVWEGEWGLWGKRGGLDREPKSCKTCLGLMRSRCVSRRLMLTAAARWRVYTQSVYPGQEGSWVHREKKR